MKINILTFYFFLSIYANVFAQENPYCEPNTTTTNPDITGGFDWRLEELNNRELFVAVAIFKTDTKKIRIDYSFFTGNKYEVFQYFGDQIN